MYLIPPHLNHEQLYMYVQASFIRGDGRRYCLLIDFSSGDTVKSENFMDSPFELGTISNGYSNLPRYLIGDKLKQSHNTNK